MPTRQWFESTILKSPSVIAYSHATKGHLAWLVDDDERDVVILAVGEDLPDHFTRGLTIKVFRTGAVYVLESSSGEEQWRLDRVPT